MDSSSAQQDCFKVSGRVLPPEIYFHRLMIIDEDTDDDDYKVANDLS